MRLKAITKLRSDYSLEYLVPVGVVAVMLVVAKITGDSAVVFPEAGALAFITLSLRPKAIVNRAYLVVLLGTFDAGLGTLLDRAVLSPYLAEPLALAIVLAELYLFESPLVPLISITMLPIVFRIGSPLYILSVFVVSGALTLISYVRERKSVGPAEGSKSLNDSAGDGKEVSKLLIFGAFFVVATLWISISNAYLPLFFMAPPVIVSGLDWLMGRKINSRFLLRRAGLMVFSAAVGEIAYRYLGHVTGSTLAFVTVLIFLRLLKDPHPPLLAFSILPQVVHPTDPVLYVVGIFSGVAVLYLLGALALYSFEFLKRFKVKQVCLDRSMEHMEEAE